MGNVPSSCDGSIEPASVEYCSDQIRSSQTAAANFGDGLMDTNHHCRDHIRSSQMAASKFGDGLMDTNQHCKRPFASNSPQNQNCVVHVQNADFQCGRNDQSNGFRNESRTPQEERISNMEIREFSPQKTLMKSHSLPVENEYRFHGFGRTNDHEHEVDAFERCPIPSLHSNKPDNVDTSNINLMKTDTNSTAEKSRIVSSIITDNNESATNVEMAVPDQFSDVPNQLSDTDEISAMTDMAHDGDDESTIVRRRDGLRATRNVELIRHRIAPSTSNTSANFSKPQYEVFMNSNVVDDEQEISRKTHGGLTVESAIQLSGIKRNKENNPIYDITLLESLLGQAEDADLSIDIRNHAYTIESGHMSSENQSYPVAIEGLSSNQNLRKSVDTKPQTATSIAPDQIIMSDQSYPIAIEGSLSNQNVRASFDTKPQTTSSIGKDKIAMSDQSNIIAIEGSSSNQNIRTNFDNKPQTTSSIAQDKFGSSDILEMDKNQDENRNEYATELAHGKMGERKVDENDNISLPKDGDPNNIGGGIVSVLANTANEWILGGIASLLPNNDGEEIKDEKIEETSILIQAEGESVEMNPKRNQSGSEDQSVEMNPYRNAASYGDLPPEVYSADSTLVGTVVVGTEVDASLQSNPSIITVKGTELPVSSHSSIIVHGVEADENISVKSYPAMKVHGVIADTRDTISLQSHRTRISFIELMENKKVVNAPTMDTSPDDSDSVSTRKSMQQTILNALQNRPSYSMPTGVNNLSQTISKTIESNETNEKSVKNDEVPDQHSATQIESNEAIATNKENSMSVQQDELSSKVKRHEADSGTGQLAINNNPPAMVVFPSVVGIIGTETSDKMINASQDLKAESHVSRVENAVTSTVSASQKPDESDAIIPKSQSKLSEKNEAEMEHIQPSAIDDIVNDTAVDSKEFNNVITFSILQDIENILKDTENTTNIKNMHPDEIQFDSNREPVLSFDNQEVVQPNTSNDLFDGIDLKFVEQYEEMYNDFLDKNRHLFEQNPKLVEILRVIKLQKILAVTTDVEAELVDHVASLENLKRSTSSYYHSKLLEAAKKKAAREIQLQQEVNTIQQATHLMENKLAWQIISKSENRAKRHHQIVENLLMKRIIDPNNPLNMLPDTKEMQSIVDAVRVPIRVGSSRQLSNQQLQQLRRYQVDNAFLKAEALVLERKLFFMYETMKQNTWIDSFFRKLNAKQHKMLKHRCQNRSSNKGDDGGES